ncbi:hypothetical protein [Moritella marina]|uniref:hypothetical protein n=1 Tax=Moritella marina TaxID=90736 RepID=UPI0037042689
MEEASNIILYIIIFIIIFSYIFRNKNDLNDPSNDDVVYTHDIKSVAKLKVKQTYDVQYYRQSGNVYSENKLISSSTVVLSVIESSLNKAGIDSVRITKNDENNLTFTRLSRSHRGRSEGEKLDGITISRAEYQPIKMIEDYIHKIEMDQLASIKVAYECHKESPLGLDYLKETCNTIDQSRKYMSGLMVSHRSNIPPHMIEITNKLILFKKQYDDYHRIFHNEILRQEAITLDDSITQLSNDKDIVDVISESDGVLYMIKGNQVQVTKKNNRKTVRWNGTIVSQKQAKILYYDID